MARKQKGSYVVNRSGINVGMKVISDGFHVMWKGRHEEHSIASFWIGRMDAIAAEARANELAIQLNAEVC